MNGTHKAGDVHLAGVRFIFKQLLYITLSVFWIQLWDKKFKKIACNSAMSKAISWNIGTFLVSERIVYGQIRSYRYYAGRKGSFDEK